MSRKALEKVGALEKIKHMMLNNRLYGWERADVLLILPPLPSTAKMLSATRFPDSISMLDKGSSFQSVQGEKDKRRNILLLGQKAP